MADDQPKLVAPAAPTASTAPTYEGLHSKLTGPILYRELARLVLNPSAKGLRIDTYSNLAFDVLLDAGIGKYVSLEGAKIALEKRLALDSVPAPLLADGFSHLREIGYAEVSDGLWMITQAGLDYGLAARQKSEADYNSMVGSYVREVQSRLSFELDGLQTAAVRRILERSLYDIFDPLTWTAASYVEAVAQPVDLENLDRAIRRNISIDVLKTLERGDEIDRVLVPAARNVFTKQPTDFARGLLQLGIKHVMWRILGLDPELTRFRQEMFKGASLLLDTNILVSWACKRSYRHVQTEWFLDYARELGVELLVSQYTLTEFATAVNFAEFLHKRSAGTRLDVLLVDNEITRDFYDSHRPEVEWSTYVTGIKESSALLVKRYSVRTVKEGDYPLDPESVQELTRILGALEGGEEGGKPTRLELHDARNILLAQEIRQLTPEAPFGSPWFITHDIGLRRAEAVARKRFKYPRPSIMTIDSWFDLIYPFIWTRADPQKSAVAFSRLLASTVLPIPPPSASSFVNYLAVELELKPEDEAIVRRIIEGSLLKRTLELELERGDTRVALDTFADALAQGIAKDQDVQRKDEVITRLVERVQTLQRVPLTGFVSFDRKAWEEGIRIIEAATTPDEKKRSLEDFASDFVRMVRGLKELARDERSAAEEVDFVVKNIWKPAWGETLLIECKNWTEPVGSQEINTIRANVTLYDAKTCVLFARKGITGSELSDAREKIRDYMKEGIHVVVLTLDDLKAVDSAETLVDLLDRRWAIPWRVPER